MKIIIKREAVTMHTDISELHRKFLNMLVLQHG